MLARALATLAAFAACFGIAARAHAQDGQRENTVRFQSRSVDLGAMLEGFPYMRMRADYEADRLLYLREGRDARELMTLSLDAPALDLEHGTRLGDIDWSRRSLRGLAGRHGSNEYVVLADDVNDERFNLFAMDRDTGSLRRLTDKPYVYAWGLDATGRYLAYVARYGAHQPYHSCLDVYDFVDGSDREVVCDDAETTFTWGNVSFSPDARTVVFGALRASDRSHENLVAVDLAALHPAVHLITDPAMRRRNVNVVREWLDAEHVVYTSDETGFTNAYVGDVGHSTSRALTTFREDVVEVAPFRVGDITLCGVIVRRPYESELFVVDPNTAAIVARRVFDASTQFLDYRGDHAMLESESRRTRLQLDRITVARDDGGHVEIQVSPRASVPPTTESRITHCHVERVSIPTFDIDPRTGTRRMLHAYLQTPIDPPHDPRERFALVEAFYGGENHFDAGAQVLCAAGAIVLSPSVRGSTGFGAEFAALNDHDLGGNEVIDLIECGRYLASRFALSPRRIGLIGASHGGYEVMRALTFPPRVNGRDDHFAWGFGIALYGFSNIVSFYEQSNIPDWVLLEAGDPASERDRLIDRSPITHAARTTGPLLLLHGENDARVPAGESRRMADALRLARRPYRYVEFAGQGHGLKGLSNQYRVWREVLGFLDPVIRSAPTGQPTAAHAHRSHRHRRLALAVLVVLALGIVAYGVRAAGRD